MSHSQNFSSREVKYCALCKKQFIPNKFNAKRQKYCTDKKCIKERSRIRNKQFRINNPTYYKKNTQEIEENTYRTQEYNQQRQSKRKFESMGKRLIIQQKRVFVDNNKSLASLLEFFFSTFLGMVIHSNGGRQSSAFATGNLLNLFYKDGVSTICANKNLKQKMESIYANISKSDQCFKVEDFANFL